MVEFNQELDRGGRSRKVYKVCVQHDLEWREEHFVRRFRLEKERLKDVSVDYGPWLRTDGTSIAIGAGQSFFQQLCTAVRYFATGATYTTIADARKVFTATVSWCVEDVSDYFYDCGNRYIRWPYRVQDKMRKAQGFYKNHNGQPMVMGCIDGTHIAIISPHKEREALFVNRKGYYSMNAMVVCDSKNLITHIDSSLAGSANDQYSFSTSAMLHEAETNESWGGFLLLGNSGNSLKDYFLTPYHRPTTPRHHAYNQWHMSIRSVVERTIGLMKQRWRCLDASGGYLYHTPERVAKIVVACAALQNMAVIDRELIINVIEGNAVDTYHAVRLPPDQPQDLHLDEEGEHEDARDVYARLNFRNDNANGIQLTDDLAFEDEDEDEE